MKTIALIVSALAVAAAQPQRQFIFSPAPQTVQRYVAQPTPRYIARPTSRYVLQSRQGYVPTASSFQTPQSYRDSAQLEPVPILSQHNVRDDTGYSYSYETADKTSVSERGVYRPGPEGDYIVAEGSYSYTSPDGVQYSVTYKADENGFQPEGAHIPKVFTADNRRFG